MAKEKEPQTPPADPDEEFFKENGVDNDDDKAYLKSAHLREKYLAHRRALEEKEKKPSKSGKGLFGNRRD